MPRRPLVDIDTLAELLQTTPEHVRGMVFRHTIPFVKVGHYVRFDLDKIDRWLAENEQAAS